VYVTAPLAASDNTTLQPATVNVAIQSQEVVQGGSSPYQISGELFQIVDASGNILQQGSGSIGPGLCLTVTTDGNGINVGGIPTTVGTYNFTFTVNDAAQHNLQQVQYSMAVSA
jgi:hypothetical protein